MPTPRLSFSVVVGNIGTVYAGDSKREARLTFVIYVDRSKNNHGRCAGEDVTWFMDDEIYKEYIGSLSLEEWEADDTMSIYGTFAEDEEQNG